MPNSIAQSVLGFANTGCYSHQMLLRHIGEELVGRGHQFAMLVSDVDEVGDEALGGVSGVQIIRFPGPPHIGTQDWAASLPQDPVESVIHLSATQPAVARCLLSNATKLDALKQAGFDLVLGDVTVVTAAILAQILEVPLVEMVAFPLVPPIFEQQQSIPNPVAYLPQFGTLYTPDMSFWQRLQNLRARNKVYKQYGQRQKTRAAILKETGFEHLPIFKTKVSTSAAVIVNADWGLEYPFPVPPRIHMVGSMSAQEANPLPQHLASFLDQGLPQGHAAVYVSMGTLARLAEKTLTSMAAALSALPNPVLWSLQQTALPGDITLESLNLGKNIKIVPAAPQNDVLGHPSVQAFVTHGGNNSIYEAAYHAVPMVVVPCMLEQGENAIKVKHHGIGVMLTPAQVSRDSGKGLLDAITTVLTQPTIKDNALRVSKRLTNKPRQPVQLAADVVERVMATKGDLYLQTKQHELPWWQLSMLDVYAVIALVILVSLGLIAYIIRAVVSAIV